MKIALDICKTLAQKTIFYEQYKSATPLLESTSDNRIFVTDEMVFKYSPNRESLEYEYICYQSLIESDYFPWPYAFVYEQNNTLLVLQKRQWTSDILTQRTTMTLLQKQKFVQAISQNIQTIHQIPAQSIHRHSPRKKQLQAQEQNIVQNPHSLPVDIHQAIRYRHELDSTLSVWKTVLHNDIWHKNFLQKDEKLTGLVDFEQWFLWELSIEWHLILEQQRYASHNKHEQELMNMLVAQLQTDYPQIFDEKTKEYVHLYSWLYSLHQRQEDTYNHDEKIQFLTKFLAQWLLKK